MIATNGFLTALECTKFVFGRGRCSGPHWGYLQSSSRPPIWVNGPNFKREGKGKGRDVKGKGKGEGREGPAPLSQIPGSASAFCYC